MAYQLGGCVDESGRKELPLSSRSGARAMVSRRGNLLSWDDSPIKGG